METIILPRFEPSSIYIRLGAAPPSHSDAEDAMRYALGAYARKSSPATKEWGKITAYAITVPKKVSVVLRRRRGRVYLQRFDFAREKLLASSIDAPTKIESVEHFEAIFGARGIVPRRRY